MLFNAGAITQEVNLDEDWKREGVTVQVPKIKSRAMHCDHCRIHSYQLCGELSMGPSGIIIVDIIVELGIQLFITSPDDQITCRQHEENRHGK